MRDLSAELGKSVELVAEGGETELDKNVIDRLGEPLVHMIRNAVDHGIEDAETRRQRDKPATGTVRLAARQEGGEVLITVSDDGGGLDGEAIRARAVERGLLAPDDRPDSADLHQLIFAPGFSTARELSSVSGRGVGMDAVRNAIEALRGSIEVESTHGKGTRVTLRLPVTLSIIDGLLVKLGKGIFVIPLAVVEECVELDATERNRESGRSMMRIREHLVAFRPLDQALGMACDNAGVKAETPGRVVVVRAEGQRMGLVVEEILGLNQTVIKPLSIYHRAIPGLAGATILGDGAVALIVDVVTLCRQGAARARGNVA
ncbi:MAG: chemotaxis protein CheW [Pararhodobacter sp.]|nr:chemotaxis protein CheW [Pararhodobacter sp.]